jgi:hypothetical protein
MPEAPKHEPHDSPLRWLIQSRTSSHIGYLVDLAEPACQCKFWQCDVSLKLKKGLATKYCQHYHMAKERFTTWAIHKFNEHDKNTND